MNQQELSAFVPTLEQAKLWRIYTPNDASLIWQTDTLFFKKHHRPSRQNLLRWAYTNEFGSAPKHYSISPPLWVLVNEISIGTHKASPVWRGSAFFPTKLFSSMPVADVSSDGEIAVILTEIQRRGGFDCEFSCKADQEIGGLIT